MKPYTIQDPQGTRTLTYPDELLWTVGDPVGYTLHVEAATGTRLRTGESMLWFIRTFNDWERARAAGGTATFAEYVGRLHPGRVDVASSPAAGRAPREPGAAARRKQKNIRRAWELHQQGHTGEQIAMELGVSPAAVSGYLRLRAATGTDGGAAT